MAVFESISSLPLWSLGVVLLLGYLFGLAVYRLYFSPIAKFPGRRLAALSFWYEFYYDVIKGGQYTWEIGRIHDRYGPIVRINPYELHVRDAEYYDVLYAGGTQKRDKWHWSAKMFGNSGSMLGTLPHDHHRLRRSALNPYFSKRSVAKLEPMIRGVIENMCRRFRERRQSGEPVNLRHIYAALTMDIITEYSFSKSYGCLDAADFMAQWPQLIDDVSQNSHVNKQFGWLFPILKRMPLWLVEATNPNMMQLINFQIDMTKSVSQVMEGKSDVGPSGNTTIFNELLNSDLPPEERTLERLVDESQTIIAAGQITTAFYLTMTSYHLIANPTILRKLRAELETVMIDHELPPLQKLESLPYLNAVMNEGFRMSCGVTHRLQRISPDADLPFQQWTIPKGTPVGMTSIFMHDNPDKFPDPQEFRPERWIGASDRLEKYLVNFSKGSRSCLGLNLARAEIYLTLAAVFRRFDLELFETTRVDADVAHDFFNPQPKKGTKGVRVIVK